MYNIYKIDPETRLVEPDDGLTIQSIEERRVAKTDVDGWRVSSVFLAVPTGDADGLPVLWETAVFRGEGAAAFFTYRGTSEEEVKKVHKQVVRNLEQGLPIFPYNPVKLDGHA